MLGTRCAGSGGCSTCSCSTPAGVQPGSAGGWLPAGAHNGMLLPHRGWQFATPPPPLPLGWPLLATHLGCFAARLPANLLRWAAVARHAGVPGCAGAACAAGGCWEGAQRAVKQALTVVADSRGRGTQGVAVGGRVPAHCHAAPVSAAAVGGGMGSRGAWGSGGVAGAARDIPIPPAMPASTLATAMRGSRSLTCRWSLQGSKWRRRWVRRTLCWRGTPWRRPAGLVAARRLRGVGRPGV